MAVVKGVNKALVIAAVVLVVLIFIVVGAAMFTSSIPIKPIISKTIELRNAHSDPVKKAQLISELDELVMDANNGPLTEQWSKVTTCLGTKCPDDAFFDTIFISASEFQDMLQNSDLVMHVLFVNRYWDNDERVVEFSKSLSAVDAAVPLLQDRKVERAWSKIVECNNQCADKDDLFFNMLYGIQ